MVRDALLYIHVLSAIVSLGPFFVMFPVVQAMRAARTTEALHAWIRVFRFAVQLSKHSGHVLVGSGALLIWVTGWQWKDAWIVSTLAILAGALFFMARAFSPTLRKLAAQEESADRTPLLSKLVRSTWIYIGLLMVLLGLMVDKPSLWG